MYHASSRELAEIAGCGQLTASRASRRLQAEGHIELVTLIPSLLPAHLLTFVALSTSLGQTHTPEKQEAKGKPAGEKVGMAGAEQAVNGRVSAFLNALRKADEAALASIYADDYSVTTDTGDVQTKAQRLDWVKANAARLSTIEFQDLKTRVYGDTAVVTGRATSTDYGINSRIIQVWVKQGDTWRVVAGQNTPIEQAKPASPPAEN
ncbi:MAG: nuclear transport factor 2 family protein [Pyrinomonadaceae bacterium]|nr:nuclear transport factor 2 family protein [Pyrinomonadaceae bacterium]